MKAGQSHKLALCCNGNVVKITPPANTRQSFVKFQPCILKRLFSPLVALIQLNNTPLTHCVNDTIILPYLFSYRRRP